MKKTILVAFGLSLPVIVVAETPAPQVDYSSQVLSNKLMQEINAELQTNAALMAAQAEIQRLQKENADLKTELEGLKPKGDVK